MAATYELIASNTLSSAAASVTFSSIPATYTDLVLRYSARGAASGTLLNLELIFNGVTSNQYSTTLLYGGLGSTVDTLRDTSRANALRQYITGNSSTANTFNSGEIYIPNYLGSTNKPFSSLSHTEQNDTSNWIAAVSANLWTNTSAITSITLTGSATNINTGSSFFLYGIKNS